MQEFQPMKLICSIATIIERARKAKPVNRNTKFSNLSTEERAALEDLRDRKSVV